MGSGFRVQSHPDTVTRCQFLGREGLYRECALEGELQATTSQDHGPTV